MDDAPSAGLRIDPLVVAADLGQVAVVGVPVRVGLTEPGLSPACLVLFAGAGRPDPDPADLLLVQALATAAAAVLRATDVAAAVDRDRERTAERVRDEVFPLLHSVSVGLHAVAHVVDEPQTRARAVEMIATVDTALSRIRTAVFDLPDRR
ncbi:hypothetical protein [Actinokineospora bangkokensis]|uniref:hypothetical protein n=1 Tax=Actinokineospora bangkokensis TaxID=1193682 RepID=UPI0011782A33|nr:hypothetical protein [Actinokineospora bangkokensis]